jgi:hypothetical protein
MADKTIDELIEDAIDLLVQCQEAYFADFARYFTGAPYALADYGWVKPAPWITLVTEGGDDDFTIHAVHADAQFDYFWRKSADPQLIRTPKE